MCVECCFVGGGGRGLAVEGGGGGGMRSEGFFVKGNDNEFGYRLNCNYARSLIIKMR